MPGIQWIEKIVFQKVPETLSIDGRMMDRRQGESSIPPIPAAVDHGYNDDLVGWVDLCVCPKEWWPSLLTHLCVTEPDWVKIYAGNEVVHMMTLTTTGNTTYQPQNHNNSLINSLQLL